jgi:hypothetical protein
VSKKNSSSTSRAKIDLDKITHRGVIILSLSCFMFYCSSINVAYSAFMMFSFVSPN